MNVMSNSDKAPMLRVETVTIDGMEKQQITLLGCWTLRDDLIKMRSKIERKLSMTPDTQNSIWRLTEIQSMDSAGAVLLWQHWKGRLPDNITMNPSETARFAALSACALPPEKTAKTDYLGWLVSVGELFIGLWQHITVVVTLIGQLILDTGFLIRHPSKIPWKEISANMYRSGLQALGISALVGVMIGLALSYLISIQLQQFGASMFIVPLLGIGVLREMGPLIAAILIAGRSGSSMTAQIGVMRITEEIDALSVMGITPVLRLVFPKVVALLIVTPLVVVWTSLTGILGGIMASKHVLGIGMAEFLTGLPKAVMMTNLWIALFKGAAFGLMIAVIACHFGLKIRPNTESLGQGTTASVVSAITVVMLMDAGFAILLKNIGI